jgi:hypothetical protein
MRFELAAANGRVVACIVGQTLLQRKNSRGLNWQ